MATRNNNSVQSLTRGVDILRLLAQKNNLTASDIAIHLGIHQSSASRQLRSLVDAGLVYKPDYHSFALDYGILLFAGIAIEGFKEIETSAKICTEIHHETGYGVAAAVLRDGRLIYLARISPYPDASLVLVNDPGFPVHRSSLGLYLSYAQGPDKMRKIIETSMGETKDSTELDTLLQMVNNSISRNGFLYLQDFGLNRFNAATVFTTPRGCASLAIYSDSHDATEKDCASILRKGVTRIEQQFVEHNNRKGKRES